MSHPLWETLPYKNSTNVIPAEAGIQTTAYHVIAGYLNEDFHKRALFSHYYFQVINMIWIPACAGKTFGDAKEN